MDEGGKKVRKRVKEKPFLPDEIITNILIRLPVKSLVRFHLVCKKWRDMILSRDFIDLHQCTSLPLILVSPTNLRYELDLFGIDKWWDLSRSRSMFQRFPFRAADIPSLYGDKFSHAGLIVLQGSKWSEPSFTILNPARPLDECVVINPSKEFRSPGCKICAVYYHPLLEEYCSLWQISESGRLVEYRLLNLGSKPSFKTVHNPFSNRGVTVSPLFINNHLYWMLKSELQDDRYEGHRDILEFDIISEEFKVISCPIPMNTECKCYQTCLLNSDGVISFLLILPSTITIWRMEDHGRQLWAATEYTASLENYYEDVFSPLRIIAVVDGKLAFEFEGILFVCNLMDGTVKNISKRRLYCGRISFVSHQMSLASLKDCKSPISIDKDGMCF